MTEIRWVDIEAECGDFRAGFVATFKKYEGQPTDEKDKAGRRVKVQVASFARHVGIPERTFRDWVEQNGGDRRDRAGQDLRRARSSIKRMSPAELIEIAEEAEEAVEEAVETGSIAAAEAAELREKAAQKRKRKPRTQTAKPAPSIEEQLTKVAMTASDSNFLMWKVMEDLDDVAPVRGEQQVRRLSRIDHARDAHDLGMRMAQALRRMVETDELDEALWGELQAELQKLGEPMTEGEAA